MPIAYPQQFNKLTRSFFPEVAFPPGFRCVCARGKKNPAGDAFEIEKGNGDMRDYDIRTAAAAILYDTSSRCTYSSLEPLVPGAGYLVYQAGSICSRAR